MKRSEEIIAKALDSVNGDRYKLSLMVSKRANELHDGAKVLINKAEIKDMKFSDIALLEIAEGKVTLDGIIKTED